MTEFVPLRAGQTTIISGYASRVHHPIERNYSDRYSEKLAQKPARRVWQAKLPAKQVSEFIWVR